MILRSHNIAASKVSVVTKGHFERALAGFCSLVLMIALLLVPRPGFALVFEPTETEWIGWPDYCRARYVVSGAGSTSKYQNRVAAHEVARHRQQIGESAWVYLHHYCAGIVYLQRAVTAESKNDTEFLLSEAQRELMSQYVLLDSSDPMFAQVTASVARLHSERGNYALALDFLEKAISAQPTISSLYAQAAVIHRDAGQIEKGLEILRHGDDATKGMSAELNYFLGLFYIEINNLDAAENHARRAYDLGYPLPGLATKLRQRGRDLQ